MSSQLRSAGRREDPDEIVKQDKGDKSEETTERLRLKKLIEFRVRV